LYKPGSADDMFKKLISLKKLNNEALSENILNYFGGNLSFKAIAEAMLDVINANADNM